MHLQKSRLLTLDDEYFPNWHSHDLASRFLMNFLCGLYEIFARLGMQ